MTRAWRRGLWAYRFGPDRFGPKRLGPDRFRPKRLGPGLAGAGFAWPGLAGLGLVGLRTAGLRTLEPWLLGLRDAGETAAAYGRLGRVGRGHLRRAGNALRAGLPNSRRTGGGCRGGAGPVDLGLSTRPGPSSYSTGIRLQCTGNGRACRVDAGSGGDRPRRAGNRTLGTVRGRPPRVRVGTGAARCRLPLVLHGSS
jgi:hypothetical protein